MMNRVLVALVVLALGVVSARADIEPPEVKVTAPDKHPAKDPSLDYKIEVKNLDRFEKVLIIGVKIPCEDRVIDIAINVSKGEIDATQDPGFPSGRCHRRRVAGS